MLEKVEVIITMWKAGEIPGYYAEMEIYKMVNESEGYIEANKLWDKQEEDSIV